MKHKYTAKVYVSDDEIIETSGDNVEELILWMNSQAEASFSEIKGDIIDNKTHQIVKSVQYGSQD